MKSIFAFILTLTISGVCYAKDFSTEAFTVKEIETWLTQGITIESMKAAFGDSPMTLGSLELIEPNKNEDEEIYASIERYVYALEYLGEETFTKEKKWSLESPSISFRFVGPRFVEAFIMNPNAENLIILEPTNNQEIGIGPPIAERPSHTTTHTDP